VRALIGAALLLAACGDPVHDRAVEALGSEKAGVRQGPLHRPGQPCLTCHGGEGPASYEMAFGGTVYALLDGDSPGAGAIVRLLDANNRTYDVTANCAGNFWVPRGAFQGTFPVTAAVTMKPSSMPSISRVMTTQMKRGGSCADCHANPAGPATPGHLWVLPDGSDVPSAECSGDQSVKGVASTLPACPAPNTDCAAPFPKYTSDVAPILEDNCVGCHQPKGQNPNPSLTSYKLVSALKTRVTLNSLVAQCRMPPPPLDPLSDADRHTIACWIAGGAKQ
jgi:mono/diheme cytochrome c family protein